MTPLTLTYSGSVFGLLAWIFIGLVYLAIAFTFGWFANEWKREAGK